MRVIITGGTGTIGRALAADLVGDYEVVVLSRNPDNYKNMPSGVKMVQWDAKTAAGWGELADGAFAIVNLAGAGVADKRWTADRKKLIKDSRVWAGQAVSQAVHSAKVKPQVVVQASAIGFYGDRENELLDEESLAGSGFLPDVVKAWEQSTRSVETMGVRRVVTRIGVVLTMAGGALPQLVQPFQLWAGGPIGNGEQWLSWVHIDDAVRGIRDLMEDSAASGVYNLTTTSPVRNEEIAQRIGVTLDRPNFLPVPPIAIKLLLGEMSQVVLDGQRVMPKRLEKKGFKFRYTDIETALRNLLLT